MNAREILEASIVDEPPPFPSIDELITRERRRRRARRAGAAAASTAGVVAAVLGVTLVTAQLNSVRTPDGSAQPPTTSAPAPDNVKPASVAPVRLPLLSMLLTTRLSAALPGAELVRGGGGAGVLGGGSGFGNDGDYLFLSADAVMDPSPASEDATRFSVTVFEPLTTAPMPMGGTLGTLYGGCAGMWSGDTSSVRASDCDERSGPWGSTVFYGWRDQPGHLMLNAVMAFPDGVAVRIEAFGKPDSVPVTAEQLAEVIADPRFVIPAWGPPAEAGSVPEQGAGWGTMMVDCLAPKGWDVHVTGGGFTSEVPAERHDQYELDVAACRSQVDYGEFVTATTATTWYDQMVASAECLRRHAYSSSQPPDREAFIGQLAAHQLPDWDPYAEVFWTRGPAAVREAQAACPPPSSW